ncbi:MAG: type I restriction endonuclease subunit R [bacterium]|nr:type I restriction endonuclease subunit R [bacterium]
MTTDTSEKGLERLICTVLAGHPCDPPAPGSQPYMGQGGVGWMAGDPHDYDRAFCVDLAQLTEFLRFTQPEVASSLDLGSDSPTRRKFLARLEGQVAKRGTVDVLRHGVKHGPHHIDLFYGTPSPDNETAKDRFEQNRFTVTRQLRYSLDEVQRALDLTLFINGLPVATFELKNGLTKQTVSDAIHQYKTDRSPREKLFAPGRCVAHFAVDETQVSFCTHLRGKGSVFLPFNRGRDDGGGNPPNPDGLAVDYLWREVLSRQSLTNILENYAQMVGKGSERNQIWPRYHQLDVVRRLLADAACRGAGRRYLIQHSAGSGKSNSIAWLSHQLIGLARDGRPVFDSIIVVTDRLILDSQINATIRQFAQVKATVGHADRSGDLRRFIEQGKKIIISTIQKFPFILDEIEDSHRSRNFAIIIDEAHSSQGGRTSTAISQALAESGRTGEEETYEDQINRLIESRKLLSNASYFAFTATPKNKTLQLFGSAEPQPDGTVRHRPFHHYSMKQAIEEGFILDVLSHYTPVESYYKLEKTVRDDPEFDTRKARKKLRRYVEGHDHAIGLKAEIMVDHFHTQVLARHKVGGQARAMVVTNGIRRTIQYFHHIRACLEERRSPYQALVAFSGEHDWGGRQVTEASLNNLPSSKIAQRFREDPYRFLVCADKFQTGYDEPLLHTMYVDKTLSGVKAVQTLSRLNRAHPDKSDVFVLDFLNDAETIRRAFEPYYRATILAEETDPNKLHDLVADLDNAEVYTEDQVDELVRLFLSGGGVEQLHPILDGCVAVYLDELDEDQQVRFKSGAKAFVRTYSFLASILPYGLPGWEKLSIFLTFLTPKLPAPQEEDLSQGILETIDMESYRVEKGAMQGIMLADEYGEIEPIPTSGAGSRPETHLDRLSKIIEDFNDLFGNIEWKDSDHVHRLITETIPTKVADDPKFRHARKNSDAENARIESNHALGRVMNDVIQDDMELFRQFTDNPSFKRWLSDRVFELVYHRSGENRPGQEP